MLVAVRKHPIEFEIREVIPEKLISGLRKEYGEANVRVERDDMVNAMEMEWFKDLESEDTPGKNLRFYRKLIGMTQPELAKKLADGDAAYLDELQSLCLTVLGGMPELPENHHSTAPAAYLVKAGPDAALQFQDDGACAIYHLYIMGLCIFIGFRRFPMSPYQHGLA